VRGASLTVPQTGMSAWVQTEGGDPGSGSVGAASLTTPDPVQPVVATGPTATAQTLLAVEGLRIQFDTRHGVVRAVNDVSFEVNAGETLGLAGESGSGKSVTALAMMGLLDSPPARIAGGRILFEGTDLLRLSDREMREVRANRIAMVFQDPMTSLDPVFTIGQQLWEPLRVHRGLRGSAARARAIELLDMVGLPDPSRRMDDYPHQLSGGMRQRVMIALAISCEPKLLLADEPTTALDVTIQAQILSLLERLQGELGLALVLITHNLGIMSSLARRIAVMYAGRILEMGSAEDILQRPRHPYTEALLRSIPRIESAEVPLPIDGAPPDLLDLPPGCPFYPRCRYRHDPRCAQEVPPLREVAPGHRVAAFYDVEEVAT
jgi:oligopeptide transport system ATP-binding protein